MLKFKYQTNTLWCYTHYRVQAFLRLLSLFHLEEKEREVQGGDSYNVCKAVLSP